MTSHVSAMLDALHRRFGVGLLVVALTCGAANPPPNNASTTASAPAGELTAAEEAELAALLTRSEWERSLTLRGSIGWRDNILLSSFAPLRRGFARAELETFFWRPMRNTWEVVSYVNGDVLRYFSPPSETRGEQQWFAHGEIRWQPLDFARFALKADGFFQDTVIDLSETEASREVAPTRTQGAFATAATRFTLPRGFAFEPLVQVKRTDYRDFPGDYDEVIAGGRLEWKRNDALRVSTGGFDRTRRYQQRVQYLEGRPLPDTRLRFHQREGDVKIATAWNKGGKWTAAATAGILENRDEATAYFDYDQRRVRLELGWERAKWKMAFDGDAKRLEYRTQTVGTGIAPPPRVADLFETMLRLERALNDDWLWFAEHTWERHRSNEVEFNYRANTVLAGAQRTF